MQLQHRPLAHRLYQTKRAVIEFKTEAGKTVLNFAYRNQSFLLGDIFGVLAAYGLTIHSISLYGQIKPPPLVFLELVGSRPNQALIEKTAEKICRAITDALAGRLDVQEMLALEFNLDAGLKQVETEFVRLVPCKSCGVSQT